MLAPPGSGKTYFVDNQPEHARHWIDQDDLFSALGFVWSDAETDPQAFQAQYERADTLSSNVKAHGFRILGSLFWDFPGTDAIVLIPEQQHRAYVASRTDLSWDRVEKIRSVLREQAARNGISIFDSLEEAIAFIECNDKS